MKVGSPAAVVSEGTRLAAGLLLAYEVVVEMVRDWRFYAWKLGVPLLTDSC